MTTILDRIDNSSNMSSTPDVLVTGSSGHLGHALMLTLHSNNFHPLGIDITPSKFTKEIGSIDDAAFIGTIFTRYSAIRYILHTATLHKPHVESHSKQDFVNTNISGTLILLEAAAKHRTPEGERPCFVFTSTTSTFGGALARPPGQPAGWITEETLPQPKNIYGVTKLAAEDLCHLVHLETRMPVIVLKTSRFFPEPDDVQDRRDAYTDDNLKVCELLYRRVDLADVVTAHVAAMHRMRDQEVTWGKYIISAPTPLETDDATLAKLNTDAAKCLAALFPEADEVFRKTDWKWLERLDRVYDSSKAVRELRWQPKYTFERAVERVKEGGEWRSGVSMKVGKRGYHDVPTGIYTT